MTAVTVDSPPLVPDCPPWDKLGGRRRQARTLRLKAVRGLIPVLVAAFVVNVFVTQRTALHAGLRALQGAQWIWLPPLVAASAATYVMAAVGLDAACRHRLMFRRTISVQVAAAFTNRLAPGGLGGMATNVRYLERCGLQRSDAVSTVGITWAAGIVVHIGVVITIGLLFWLQGGDHYRLSLPSAGYWPVAGGLVVLVAGAALLAWRLLGDRLAAAAGRIRGNISGLRQRPGDLGRLVAGSAGMTCSHTVALVIAVRAFGGGASVLSIAAVYLAATGFAAAFPIPGGVGPLETALAAGLVGVGVASGAAVAAVLAYRMATFWLPIIPGALTFRALRRRRIL